MPPLQHPHTGYTPSLQLHSHAHHTVTPGFVDRPRWSDGVAGEMERYAGWWTKSGMIGLPPPHRYGSSRAGPIAGPYAKRIAWSTIWVGIRIITIVVISAWPLEVRGTLRRHTLQWHNACPGSRDGIDTTQQKMRRRRVWK